MPESDDVRSAFLAWLEAPYVAEAAGVLVLVLSAALALVLTRRVVLALLHRAVAQTSTNWDDALQQAGVFHRIVHVVPTLVVYYGVGLVPDLPPGLVVLVQRVAIALVLVLGALSVNGALRAANEIYRSDEERRRRPIRGFIQLGQLLVTLVATLLVLATLLDRSPWVFLSGLGALAAVLLLVFRDTILSLVASVQLTSNDMIQVGDWIEMPQFGADGDVIEVALHTVKVQNWDKTITTIPTHRLIDDSFKNWRGMSQSGGRRIKRALHLDLGSIRFLTDDEVERLSSWEVLHDYMAEKRAELEAQRERDGLDPDDVPHLRRLTNAGTFRAYVVQYLRRHPKIHRRMTLLVRQLEPGARGLPIEIYAFTNITEWGEYEDIQADLFDHMIAVLPEFGLRAFQDPGGADLARLGVGE